MLDIFRGFEDAVPEEIPKMAKLEVEGEVPAGLRGVLYRNGPGKYTIHGDRYTHLFDGDGLATRVSFQDDGAYYTSRFVQSKHKVKEDLLGKRIYGTYATRPVGGPLARFINRDFKNVSNTNLVYQWDKAFALYEGGPPYELDPVTLKTVREEGFSGKLADQQKFSAHPHRDPETGDLWNFGLTRKKETVITVYNMTQSGAFEVPFEAVSPYSGIVHDFGFTSNYLVFVIPPVRLPKVPLGIILGQRSFFESLKWHPEEETCILTIDKRNGAIQRYFTPPFMNFHIANTYEQDDRIVVDLCNFDDFEVMQSMAKLIDGKQPNKAVSYLERLVIQKNGDVSRTRLSDVSMEFPRTVEAAWGKPCRYYYGASWSDRDWITVPMMFDIQTGETQLADLKPHQFGGEPVPVPKSDDNLDDVWLLHTVFDAELGKNQIHILDSQDFGGQPLAKLTLPQRIPFQLHGNWVSSSNSV